MNARGDGPRRWPTTPGGTASTPEQAAAAEAAVADLLTWPESSGRPLDGGHLTLSYIPFTDLGRDDDLDLSWETQVERGGGKRTAARVEVAVGATPVEVLDALIPAHQGTTLDQDAAAGWSAAARALERGWAGWADLLREATAVAAAGPASPEEPSQTAFDVKVRWDDHASPPGWVWTLSVWMVDTAGEDVGRHEWRGTSPAEALRVALADSQEWFRPVPVWPQP